MLLLSTGKYLISLCQNHGYSMLGSCFQSRLESSWKSCSGQKPGSFYVRRLCANSCNWPMAVNYFDVSEPSSWPAILIKGTDRAWTTD